MDMDRRHKIEARVSAHYDQLKRDEAHNRMLRDPSIGGHAPRPSPQLIEASIGQMPRTDRQLKKQARDNVAAELQAERRLQRKQNALHTSIQQRDVSNQNAQQQSVDPKEQQRQALRNKLKNDHQRAQDRSRSR